MQVKMSVFDDERMYSVVFNDIFIYHIMILLRTMYDDAEGAVLRASDAEYRLCTCKSLASGVKR